MVKSIGNFRHLVTVYIDRIVNTIDGNTATIHIASGREHHSLLSPKSVGHYSPFSVNIVAVYRCIDQFKLS
jgi:hypothetical protein